MQSGILAVTVLAMAASALAGCTLPPPSPAQRAAASYDSVTDTAPDAPGPRGILATSAPGDDVAQPLQCRQQGPETHCTRGR